MILNDYGQIVSDEWEKTAMIRPGVQLDAWVVMPDHFHGIIVITNDVATARRVPAKSRVPASTTEHFGKPVPGSVPTIIRSFKSAVTKGINEIRNTPGAPVWQKNYYERIIKNELSLNRVREYIIQNPLRSSIRTSAFRLLPRLFLIISLVKLVYSN